MGDRRNRDRDTNTQSQTETKDPNLSLGVSVCSVESSKLTETRQSQQCDGAHTSMHSTLVFLIFDVYQEWFDLVFRHDLLFILWFFGVPFDY